MVAMKLSVNLTNKGWCNYGKHRPNKSGFRSKKQRSPKQNPNNGLYASLWGLNPFHCLNRLYKRGVNMVCKLCGETVTDKQYLEILDIMTRNNYQQIIKEQVIHFKKSGWFAMNKNWYKTAGAISIIS